MSSYRMKYKIGATQYHIPVQEDIAGFGSGVPLGTILPYPANSEYPPEGFLWCDGSAVSRAAYPDLFALIGTLYGSGDGTTTFNLPDLTGGKFLEGTESAGISKSAGLPNITGYYDNSYVIVRYDQVGGAFSKRSSGQAYYGTSADGGSYGHGIKLDASDSNAIYGASTTVQPSSVTVRYIIKVFSVTSSNSELVDVTALSTEITKKFDPRTDFTIVYPNNGTAQNPANVAANSKYVEDNPFPGYFIQAEVEIFNATYSKWFPVKHSDYYTSQNLFGIEVYQFDSNIVIKTQNYLADGLQAEYGSGTGTSAPCRVKVWKIGKLPT